MTHHFLQQACGIFILNPIIFPFSDIVLNLIFQLLLEIDWINLWTTNRSSFLLVFYRRWICYKDIWFRKSDFSFKILNWVSGVETLAFYWPLARLTSFNRRNCIEFEARIAFVHLLLQFVYPFHVFFPALLLINFAHIKQLWVLLIRKILY